MKKLLLLPIILMMGCGNSTPKCEESKTVLTVKEIILETYQNRVKYNILLDKYSSYDITYRKFRGNEKISEMDSLLTEYINNYVKGHKESIPDNMLKLIEEKYDSYSLTNIRTNSIDEPSKTCNCSAQFKAQEGELNYKAQRNSEGDIYVTVEARPFFFL